MRHSLFFRIAMWASVGFLVSVCWGFYFATADKAKAIEPVVYALARLTEPVVAVIVAYEPNARIGLHSVIVWNAATYALIGLILEAIRRYHPPLQISN